MIKIFEINKDYSARFIFAQSSFYYWDEEIKYLKNQKHLI